MALINHNFETDRKSIYGQIGMEYVDPRGKITHSETWLRPCAIGITGLSTKTSAKVNRRSKAIVHIESGVIYSSLQEAADDLGMPIQTIYYKVSRGLGFEYFGGRGPNKIYDHASRTTYPSVVHASDKTGYTQDYIRRVCRGITKNTRFSYVD
jgi:hypothetical protein